MADPGEDIHDIKRAAQESLLVLPGVHAVGVGPKIVGGKFTGELAIKVYTIRKKALTELTDSEVIPAEIAGVKTDVVEMAVPVLHAGPDTAKERPLIFGTMIRAKNVPEEGTLGFLAHTSDTPPKLVALTCQHVVAPPRGSKGTDLTPHTPTGTPNPYKITIGGSNTPGSLVVVKMASNSQRKRFNAYWTTTNTDTPDSIAKSIIAAINGITGANVTAAPGPNPEDVVITTSAGADTVVGDCSIYDPVIPDPNARLLASVAGNVVTLTGVVDGEYSIYTSWNVNGSEPTHGVFTPVTKGSAVTDVAGKIASAVTALSITGITGSATGASVTIAGAVQVLCQIISDIRVGQPTDGFSSNCSLCCSDEIGRVLAARTDLDIALIQLIKGLAYQDQIKGDTSISKPDTAIKGVHTVTTAEAKAHYAVNLRGALSLYQSGTVDSLNNSGYTTNSPVGNEWTVFGRYYDSAMFVVGNGGVAFSEPGDSGSAVFNNNGEIVGMLFAGTSARSVVTPIDQIVSKAAVTVVTATALGQTQKVSDTEGVAAMVRLDNDLMTHQVLEAQAEISATPAGKVLTDLVRRHAEEVQTLVNTNTRVATVWHRNGGPKIAQVVFRYLQEQNKSLSDQLEGLSLKESLKNIQRALMKYGSDALSIDLKRYGSQILEMTSLSYPQLLAQMQGTQAFFSNT